MATTKSDGAPNAPAFVLSEDELHVLSPHATMRHFPKNAVIVNAGDQADAIFIIRTGRVKVFLDNDDGKEVTLNTHGPGEYFGEMVLDEGPRSASVITLEASQFMVISKAEFRSFLAGNPEFAMKLISRLMHRVRALTVNVANLALLDVYGRVAGLLRELAKARDGRLVIAEKLTHQDIADRVGASREMVSRIIKDLVAGGYITVEKKEITIRRDLPERW